MGRVKVIIYFQMNSFKITEVYRRHDKNQDDDDQRLMQSVQIENLQSKLLITRVL